MICPHCTVGTDPQLKVGARTADGSGILELHVGACTECRRAIVVGVRYTAPGPGQSGGERALLFPTHVPPRPTPPEVPKEYGRDFREAALVLSDSPKASAAISRRLLQQTLREKGGFKAANLDKEIQAAIDSGSLPPDLAHDLDALRTVGNFAAHPIKSTNSGEVIDVEPSEAEWLLDLLDELLQHYFTRPAIRAKRRAGLNSKLQEAGKPALKGTPPPPPVLGT